jgi:predicted ATP-binding protein involved in virulence
MARRHSEIRVENHRKKTASDPLPAYFLSLTVENLRCFGPEQTLDLSNGRGRPSQWTIVLGDNGVGKTTLLQSLAAVVPLARENIFGVAERGVMPRYALDSKLSSKWEPYRDDGTQAAYLFSATFQAGLRLAEEGPGTKVADFLVRGVRTHGYDRASIKPYQDLRDFCCFGYGAARRMGEASLSAEVEDDPTGSLFSENVALLNAEEWLLQADYAASKPSPSREQARNRRDQIKEVLIRLLPDVEDIRFAQLSEPQLKAGVEVKTAYGWVSMRHLSLGYRTLTAWMVDLASRLFDRYPDSPNPLAEPAVVLVDEIDLHLHPKWQRSLMGYLTDLFPNTQFIATAHSPLVVQAATEANIAVLRREGDHVIIDNDIEAIRGWRIDQVLTSDLFGLESARPPQLDELLAERRRLLSKGRITQKDKERLRKLEARIGPLPAGETQDDIEAMDIIRRAAERLRQQ